MVRQIIACAFTYIVAVLSNRDNVASPLADKIGSTLNGVKAP